MSARRLKYFREGTSFIEIVTASLIFSIFLLSAFLLFRSGRNIGEKTLWNQKKNSDFRNIERQFCELVKQAAFPCTILFPSGIIENNSPEFSFFLTSKNEVKAVSDIIILYFTIPEHERRGGDVEKPLKISYYSLKLTSEKKLILESCTEKFPLSTPPDYVKSIRRSINNASSGASNEKKCLIDEVESIKISVITEMNNKKLIQLKVKTVSEKNYGTKEEKFTLKPQIPVNFIAE
ncbi:MAG: hypothetical protein HQM10_22120 [Candidatus Riflebacteria bacterium]|nr:hypothetical protein [Candidatus Riflebacteria bacterium]